MDAAALYEQYRVTMYGSSSAVTRAIPTQAEAEAIAAYLNRRFKGTYAVHASRHGGFFVRVTR